MSPLALRATATFAFSRTGSGPVYGIGMFRAVVEMVRALTSEHTTRPASRQPRCLQHIPRYVQTALPSHSHPYLLQSAKLTTPHPYDMFFALRKSSGVMF